MKQRSPVIFWLLLAATLAVDAVAVSWLFGSGRPAPAEILFDALSFSQVSVACIAWMFAIRQRLTKAIAALTTALVASLVMSAWQHYSIQDGLALFGSQLIAVSLSLWILKRTPWWQRRTWSSASHKWQFSVGQVMIAMTVTSLLLVVTRDAEVVHDAGYRLVPIIAGNILLVIGSLCLHNIQHHGLIGFASSLAIAIVVGLVNGFLRQGFFISFLAYYVIQATVLFLWLEFGSVIDRDGGAADGLSSTNMRLGKPV